jgi:hypothetical protein
MKQPLPRILSAVPQTLHVQLEIAKAIRTLMAPAEDDPARRRAEIIAIGVELEAIKRDLHKVGEECLALIRVELQSYFDGQKISKDFDKAGFRSDQPRWRKGSGRRSGCWSGEKAVSSRIKPIGDCVAVITTCLKRSSRVSLRRTS